MKLISTEIDESMIQLTYTGGLPENKSDELLIYRYPHVGGLGHSILWHRMSAMQHLQDWASEEYRRLRNETEKNA